MHWQGQNHLSETVKAPGPGSTVSDKGKLTVEVRVFGPLNIAPNPHRRPRAVFIMELISPSVVARSKRPSTFQKFDGRAN